jgi:hypothetical protein
MSQIKKLLNDPTNATALAPVDNTALTPGAKFAEDEGTRRGELMKFVKGEFLTGGIVVPLGTRFVAHVLGAERGWIRFNGEGEPPTQVIGKIAHGYELLPREKLGDNDDMQWQIGLDGEPDDPWKKVVYLPMILVDEGPNEGMVLTFSTMTETGRRAVSNLYTRFETLSWKYRGQLPIVEIGCKTLDNDFSTRVPVFPIVGWQPIGGEGAPLPATPSTRDDLDDEIPFA